MTKRDDARLAMLATLVAGIFLGLVLADDVLQLRLLGAPASAFASGGSTYFAVAAAMVLGGLGPWLAWSRRRGRAAVVRCAPGVVHAGNLGIAAADVSAVSVAEGARGRSVAVAHRGKLSFLEVEGAGDAARLVASLATSSRGRRVAPPLDGSTWRPPSRALALPQAVLSFVALVAAPFYYLAATRGWQWSVDPKGLFGVMGVVAAELSLALLVARNRSRRHAVALGRKGAWDAHVALHRAQQDDAEPASAGARVRVATLARGDENVGVWLARLDALPTEQHAYRGDSMQKDVLWETLGDDGAPVDARMAAARVLRRRYGEENSSLARVVEDPDVRVRVEAALEDHEDAERRIAMLGPLFRAR